MGMGETCSRPKLPGSLAGRGLLFCQCRASLTPQW